jgi:ATP-binding cassette subfamily B protein
MEKKKRSWVKFSTVLKYFWPSLLKLKWQILVVFLASTSAIFLGAVFQPVVYKNIINAIYSASVPGFTPEIWHWFVILILALLGNSLAWRISDYAFVYTKTKITKDLSDRAFSLTINHSRKFFSDNFSGSIVAKHSRFTGALTSLAEITLFSFWLTIVSITGILIVLFSKNSLLGFIFLFWSLGYTALSIFFARRKIPYNERRAAANSRTTGLLSDIVTNILTVKVFSFTKGEAKNYFAKTDEEEKLRRKAGNVSNFHKVIQSIMLFSLEIGGMYAVITLWSKGVVDIGFVVLVQVYITQLDMAIWNMGNAIIGLQDSISDTKEMVEIFETPIDILDPAKPEKCKIKNGNISFENVSFEYKDGKDVFKKFKLEIPAGQKVGFVGHSGSGKTTITNLLLRFEDVQSGAIKIDGQDIRNITQDDLRRNISYVPQEPALFHRSLEENIMYGDPNASKLAMLEASKKAHADEFIREFKDGYDTLVGERGVKLSGGQRQRVAIARVMLKDAPILILDEATSSLDSISENLIQKAFDEVMKDRTTLVIAHRLSTVQKMDRIVVLDKGKIVEDGGHAELLAKGGYYFKLWQAQKDGVI